MSFNRKGSSRSGEAEGERTSLAEVREVVAPFESRPVADDGG